MAARLLVVEVFERVTSRLFSGIALESRASIHPKSSVLLSIYHLCDASRTFLIVQIYSRFVSF